MRLLLASLLATVFAVASAQQEDAVLRLVASERTPVVWRHRDLGRTAVEVVGSGDVLAPGRGTATVTVLATPQGGARTITLALAVVDPASGAELGALAPQAIPLAAGATWELRFALTLGEAALARIAAAGRLHVAPLRIHASVREADVALPIADGYVGVARHAGAPAPVQAAIALRDGVPVLQVDGEDHPGLSGFTAWNWIPLAGPIARLGERGMHLHEVVMHVWDQWEGGRLDPDLFARKVDEAIMSVVGRDPQARIILRWRLFVPKDWGRRFPAGRIVYDDGTTDTAGLGGRIEYASYASREWREQYEAIIRTAVRRVVAGPFADRVFMIKLGYGNHGEWNHFGYGERKFPDFSPQMRDRFAAWLDERHGGAAGVAAAWGLPLASLDAVAIPTRAERLASGDALFRLPQGSQAVSDYYRFFSELTADTIAHFGRVVKEASDGRLLYASFYSYFAHHLASAPYHSLDSGHFATGRLLRSPYIDAICSPYSYNERPDNYGLGIPVESIKAHGKLFMSETDLPTHGERSGKFRNHHAQIFCRDAAMTRAYYLRDAGRILTRSVGGYWYNVYFNQDYTGWFDYPEFGELAERVAQARREAAGADLRSVADVAVVLDEDSVADLGLGASAGTYGRELYTSLALALDRSGAAWDCWLASDIEQVAARGYRLVVLASQFRRSAAVEAALRGHRGSLLWAVGSGQFAADGRYLGDGDWTGLRVLADAAGSMRSLAWPDGRRVALPQPISPELHVAEAAGVESLARLDSGRCGFARTPRAGGWLYFHALPRLDPAVLRQVYRDAGVHVYSEAPEVCASANASFVNLWSAAASGALLAVRVGGAGTLRDVWSGEEFPLRDGVASIPTVAGRPLVRLLRRPAPTPAPPPAPAASPR